VARHGELLVACRHDRLTFSGYRSLSGGWRGDQERES